MLVCLQGSTDETPKDNNNNSCTDTCNNAFAGLTVTDGTVACDEYAPALYESGTVSCSDTCEADLTACVEKSSPAAGEFQSCSASVPCQEGLECAENPIEAGKFACLTPCTDDASCTGSVCVGFTETSAYCMQNTAQRDQECFSNFKVCADEAATCTFTDFDDNDNATGFRCKIECEAATLGEAGSCTGGETCLPSGFIDTVQTTDGAEPAAEQANWVSCENDDSACNAAEGFECIALTVGSFCTRQGAWCGNSVDYCGDTETVDGVIACYQNGVGRCSLDFGHDICADVVSTVEGEDGALNYCLDLAGTDEGLCLGICDGRVLGDGTGPDLNCGEGAECLAINEPFFGIPARALLKALKSLHHVAKATPAKRVRPAQTSTVKRPRDATSTRSSTAPLLAPKAEQHVDRQFKSPVVDGVFFFA